MKRTTLLKTMLLLCALVVGSSSAWAAVSWVKVSDYSSLNTSDTYVIAGNIKGATTWYSLKNNQVTSKTNLPHGSTLTIAANQITSTVSDDETWVLESTNTSGVYYIKSTKGAYYLQNDGSTGSKINTKASTDSQNQWRIHYYDANNSGTGATALYNVGKSRLLAVYNSSDWRCYASTNYSNIADAEVVLFKKVIETSYTITPSVNNPTMGSVSLSGSIIVATPNSGYRVKAGDAGYTVTSGTATVVNNGDNTFTVTPSTDCSITINFEAVPIHVVNWSVNGKIIGTEDVYDGAEITFADPESGIPTGYAFKGWSTTEILTPQSAAPAYVTSATCTADVTYYAVLALITDGLVETLSQTLTYTTSDNYPWNIGGSYTDKNTYTLFHNGGYVKSESFDLSKLCKVKVYGGTFGGSSTYKSFTIGDGTNIWKSCELTGTNNAKEHTFTDGTALSGTGELYITSTCGSNSGDGSGIRVSKVEIFTMETGTIYSDYCTTVPPVQVTITAAKWATFSCDKALDFSDTDVTAYIAKAKDDSNVTLTKIEKVPANTGIVVNASAAGTFDIPVLSGDAEDTTGNLLKPWLTAGEPTETTYYYTLAVNSGGEPVFYTSEGGELAANKAYLVMPGNNAPSLGVFIDGATGIDSVHSSQSTVQSYYNLNGQRVAQPTKGLYIVNGRKVIVK